MPVKKEQLRQFGCNFSISHPTICTSTSTPLFFIFVNTCSPTLNHHDNLQVWHFHLLLQIFEMHCQIICLPFQLFLLLEELSNITYSCLFTLTVVQNLVRSNQLNVSHFVIQHQLLPSHSLEIPCRPSKGVPSECLRLVEVINFA